MRSFYNSDIMLYFLKLLHLKNVDNNGTNEFRNPTNTPPTQNRNGGGSNLGGSAQNNTNHVSSQNNNENNQISNDTLEMSQVDGIEHTHVSDLECAAENVIENQLINAQNRIMDNLEDLEIEDSEVMTDDYSSEEDDGTENCI